ncbi:hypothetical protein EVAR_30413_1 [Eumeta japonica]|uniref:Uncharacterized protein n=1 Tax=Eumeta variegata TaxID=151549 RepID=A0A4C1W6W0_EUMVA|nr:hypothetical protein EVAR_30413_1 [Eumeta japonica]
MAVERRRERARANCESKLSADRGVGRVRGREKQADSIGKRPPEDCTSRSINLQYNARNSAAVKSVTKASRWRKIDARGRRGAGPAHHTVRRQFRAAKLRALYCTLSNTFRTSGLALQGVYNSLTTLRPPVCHLHGHAETRGGSGGQGVMTRPGVSSNLIAVTESEPGPTGPLLRDPLDLDSGFVLARN